MKKSTIFLLILLAIFFTSTLVLLYLNFNKSSVTTSTSTPTIGFIPTETVSPTAIPTVNPTADWKTYENKGFGIGFKYPSDCKVENGVDYIRVRQIEPEQNLIIAIDFKKTTLSIEDLINNFEKTDITFKQINPNVKPEKISINGISAQKIEYLDGIGIKNISIIASNSLQKILIEHRFSSDNTITQILSTFKFL